MSSGRLGSGRIQFDSQGAKSTSGFDLSETQSPISPEHMKLTESIYRTRDYLLNLQQQEGYWVGELEGDTILESEYILLLAFLRRGQSEEARRAANYLLQQQLASGGWAMFPDGPLEISASVKAYLALRITGQAANTDAMTRARDAILEAGGAECVNSFTRFYLALMGVISYDKCPAVPPEIVLVPRWMPLNIYEMSAWSRTIVVPLSIIWAHRPCVSLQPHVNIEELFVSSPEDLSLTMGSPSNLDDLKKTSWFDWSRFFRTVDRTIKILDKCRIRPLRRWGIRRATRWMTDRFVDSDGLGAIFPPIVWSVVALKCLGFDDDSPDVRGQLHELEKLVISEGACDRLQPCKSPVWDTAIATIALREADVPIDHPSMNSAVKWLLSKEVRQPGDWSTGKNPVEPSGWFFEFNNRFYPDVDDTAMVVIALSRCLPSHAWSADFLIEDWSPHTADDDAAAILSSHSESSSGALQDIERQKPILTAIHRGTRWILAMQNRDGGWGAFDRDNDREILTRVPFADHNAMIDPSSSDLTARILEMLAGLNADQERPAIQHAIEHVWRGQEADHCWYGRWGVNYVYGTWQVVVGLTAIGVPLDDPRLRSASDWLKSKQQESGGWGETPRSYDDPSLRGTGTATASQTAWALMGLMATGDVESESVRRGIEFLLTTQQEDGTWDEEMFTGTGFPRVFYLKYHLYRIYFPLMAMARFAHQTGCSLQ